MDWIVIVVRQVQHAGNFATVLFPLAERGEKSARVVLHAVGPGGKVRLGQAVACRVEGGEGKDALRG